MEFLLRVVWPCNISVCESCRVHSTHQLQGMSHRSVGGTSVGDKCKLEQKERLGMVRKRRSFVASRNVWGLKEQWMVATVIFEQQQLQLLILSSIEFWKVSNLNELSTKQKGKSKRMLVGLVVQVAPSTRKEKTQISPKQGIEKHRRILCKGNTESLARAKWMEIWTLPWLSAATAWTSETSTNNYLSETLLRRLQSTAER